MVCKFFNRANKAHNLGSCQFPTLGFVVDRYFRVKNFVPETFWLIKIMHTRDDIDVTFHWDRNRLFDRAIVTILFERCTLARKAKITGLIKKPTSKWRPLPLTTVELQKLGSKYLRMDSQRVMKVAEDLYTKGWISYPRTETDQFDRGIDLRRLVEKQVQDNRWGNYAQGLMNGGFRQPRSGSHNDQAHPPIHPVNYVNPAALGSDEERRVYEFVARRFLGCCSDDAKGKSTEVSLAWGPESFHANGLLVLERNYLDVYVYDKWESSQQLPNFRVGEEFEPKEGNVKDGQTSPPGYLTEPELIALMDANGIGTDATMAEHIAKIKEREYVTALPRSGVTANAMGSTRGRGGGRGRGRGRGGRGGGANGPGQATGGGQGLIEFIPTTLGTALIMGYEAALSQPLPGSTQTSSASTVPSLTTASTATTTVPSTPAPNSTNNAVVSPLNSQSITSLGKPFLRKEMEQKFRDICDGKRRKAEVVREVVAQYEEAYAMANLRVAELKRAIREYVLGERGAQGGR